MKKAIILLILSICVVGFASAQSVESKYDTVQYDPAVANAASGVGDRTALELRDYGVDLFITGMVLNYVAPAAILGVTLVAGIGSAASSATSGSTTGVLAAASGILIGGAIAALVSTVGFGMWVAGAVYWGNGNQLLARGGLALTDPRDDWLVVFEGTQIAIRY